MPYLSHNYRCKPKPRLKSLTEAGMFFGLSILAIMLTLSILGYVFAWAAQAAPGINKQINYQGKMSTASGATVTNASWSFRFRIYDAASNGNLLWTERWNSTTTPVTTINGVFSVALGSLGQTDSLDSIDWNSDSLYLQIDLDADNNGTWEESFNTRKQFTSATYSFNSDLVDGIHATSTAAVANYLMALDSNAGLTVNGVTSTANLNVSGSSTLATTTFSFFDDTVNGRVYGYNFSVGSAPYNGGIERGIVTDIFGFKDSAYIWSISEDTNPTFYFGSDDSSSISVQTYSTTTNNFGILAADNNGNSTDLNQFGIIAKEFYLYSFSDDPNIKLSGINTADIRLNSSTDEIYFENAAGGYNFDNNVTTTGGLSVVGEAWIGSNIIGSGSGNAVSISNGGNNTGVGQPGNGGIVNLAVGGSNASGPYTGGGGGIVNIANGGAGVGEHGGAGGTVNLVAPGLGTFIGASGLVNIGTSTAANAQLFVYGNSTTTGSLQVQNIATLATTTMAFNSKISDSDGTTYVEFYTSNLNDPGWGVNNVPAIKFHNTSGVLRNDTGGIYSNFAVIENDSGDYLPTISLASHDISEISGGASVNIEYATTTDQLMFSDAAGGYYFDNNVTTTGGFEAGSTLFVHDNKVLVGPSAISLLTETTSNSLFLTAQTVTDLSVQKTLGGFALELDPAADSDKSQIGLMASVNVKSGNNKNLSSAIGFAGESFHGGTGNINYALGTKGSIELSGLGTINTANGLLGEINNGMDLASGTITNANAVSARIAMGSNVSTITNASLFHGSFDINSGTLDNAYSFYAQNPTGAGTINNLYGLYIADQTHGGTTNYNIYSAGTTGINYFGGNVGIATTTPPYPLTVSGHMMATGTAVFGTDLASASSIISQGDAGVVGLGNIAGVGGFLKNNSAGARLGFYSTGSGWTAGISAFANSGATYAGHFSGDVYINGNVTSTGVISASQYNIGNSGILAIGAISNLFVGVDAGFSYSGNYGTFLGYQSGYDASQDGLTSLGYQAGYNNTGTSSIFAGYQAGYNNTRDLVAAFGWQAAWGNTGGSVNAFGPNAAYGNSGSFLIAAGYNAAAGNSGSESVVLGHWAGYQNTGDGLATFGSYAGYQNSGTNVSAIGEYAGYLNTGSTVAALGTTAARENTGSYLSALGGNAGYLNSGDYLIALGYGSGTGNTGSNVIALGRSAAVGNTYNSVIALGYNAKPTANNQLVVGDYGGTSYITDGYFGSGVTSTAPYAFTLHASGGYGGDVNGADLRLVGGAKAGAGLDGDVILGYDGTSQIGNIGLRTTTTPAYNVQALGALVVSEYSGLLGSGSDGSNTGLLLNNVSGVSNILAYGYDVFNIGTRWTKDLIIKTANTERMRITSDGNVGVGTTTPQYPVTAYKASDAGIFYGMGSVAGSKVFTFTHDYSTALPWSLTSGVAGISHTSMAINDGTDNILVVDGANNRVGIGDTTPTNLFTVGSGDLFTIDSSGNVTTSGKLVVGATNPTANMEAGDVYIDGNVSTTKSLYVGGDLVSNGTTTPATDNTTNLGSSNFRWRNVYSANGTIITSDLRLKENVADLSYGLDQILAFRPVTYTWKNQTENNNLQLGFVAQEVLAIAPELVDIGSDANQWLGLRYDKFVPILVKAMQQQNEEIQNLKTQLAATSTQALAVGNTDSNLQTLAVTQTATFYGTIYVKGDAEFEHKVVFKEDIEVLGKIYASKDQAGTTIILANTTSTEIIFEKEYEVVPKIALTPNSDPNCRFWLENKTAQGFRIVISENQSVDLTFDWIALAVKADGTQPVADNTVPPTDNNPPPEQIFGCTDSNATNYNPSATQNDNSCLYPQTDPPAETPTEPEPILGCMDQTATNYNPIANQDDGSCQLVLEVLDPEEPIVSNNLPTETGSETSAAESISDVGGADGDWTLIK